MTLKIPAVLLNIDRAVLDLSEKFPPDVTKTVSFIRHIILALSSSSRGRVKSDICVGRMLLRQNVS